MEKVNGEPLTLERQVGSALAMLSMGGMGGVVTQMCVLGRRFESTDPVKQWDTTQWIYVASRLVSAVICGSVPLPRMRPIAVDEQQRLTW